MHSYVVVVLLTAVLQPDGRVPQCDTVLALVPPELLGRAAAVSTADMEEATRITHVYFSHMLGDRSSDQLAEDRSRAIRQAYDRFGPRASTVYLASVLAVGRQGDGQVPQSVRVILGLPDSLPAWAWGEWNGGMLGILPDGRALADSGLGLLAAVLQRHSYVDNWVVFALFHLLSALHDAVSAPLPGARAVFCALANAEWRVTWDEVQPGDVTARLVAVLELRDSQWSTRHTEQVRQAWADRRSLPSESSISSWREILEAEAGRPH